MTAYSTTLFLHNSFRWAILAVGLYALFRATTGILAKGGWLPADDKARKLFPIALDIQFLLGIVLMFVSPVAQNAFSNMGEAMGNREIRLAVIEHPFIAIAALALAHVGSVKIRKLKDSREKFKALLLYYGLALLLLVARMPTWKLPHLG
ncbi:MAG TPA: hypothetical protein PK208_09595 [Fibrobacteria bacterium]|nr:hypothetical protein [Fibrobacteria bacterium]